MVAKVMVLLSLIYVSTELNVPLCQKFNIFPSGGSRVSHRLFDFLKNVLQSKYRFHQANFILGEMIGSTPKYNMNTQEF